MGASNRIDGAPRSVIVVGAGIVGLSTAWFLQERGVEVTVVDRVGIAAGSSWGNAGWISPALAIPLNEAANLRFGLRSLLSPTAPLQVPLASGPTLWAFLARFAANSRPSVWRRAVRANAPLSAESLEAYDVLLANGVDAPITDAPITAIFRTSADAERLLEELRRFSEAGQPVFGTELTGAALAERVPLASPAVAAGVQIDGQRFLDPGRFVTALGRAVAQRGAALHIVDVTDVGPTGDRVAVTGRDGTTLRADAAVIASGAWLSRLVARWVRVPVRAGRGYSFSVPVDGPVTGPIYLPDARVACTPLNARLRVAGTMEFGHADGPINPARIEAIVAATRPLLDGVRWEERTDEWVGPRPVSPDGRPLVGEVCPRTVYVAGGHGMWGMTHGPVTGRLLAEQITTGKQSAALRDLDPLR
ncbi:amino acid dehydrogenase [Mycolicibacter minnesotensis]|uniref:Amino acid dehydrogenase n=1 Tax=Mycolicibacter minnesotensis TaxID=1118379 RepID=A0A7I7R1D7_9MYCO|nr:FAD-dependent oxidoreductase [Mycolicibacter minnesotensis]ORB02230.1 amino acid dehydrogenase [Mycolicibacter minnesotensis]BBY32469.1 D-amino-acid dehydrogenase [Mycolicibacter minnesotensis]